MNDTPTPGGTPEAAGGTPAPPEGADKASQLSVDDLRAALEATRKENATYRTRLKALEAAEEERKAASLSEQEKRQKVFEEAQKAATEAAAQLQATRLQLAVEKAARKAGIVDEDAAFRLLDTSALERDEAGVPTNVEALLEKLLKERPWLASPPPAAGGSGGSSAAPARGRGAALTKEDVARMSSAEINARWDEVQKALSS